MRHSYTIHAMPETAGAGADRRVKLFLQLAVLVFWGPCCVADIYLLWRDRGGDGGGAFVFELLFRQALVFLALWFTVAITHGLMRGRGTPAEPRRRRRRSPDVSAKSIAPIRYNRGQ